MLFVFLLVSLVIGSDLIANNGVVSKHDLIPVIENHIHSDAEVLTRHAGSRSRI
ncbi:MAG: hypothetical protein IIC60_12190 [Proteobacteria bacterium]|nr:hypothetical protein [Pseudomonadota bacterium]